LGSRTDGWQAVGQVYGHLLILDADRGDAIDRTCSTVNYVSGVRYANDC
jgi:hypothetical protein